MAEAQPPRKSPAGAARAGEDLHHAARGICAEQGALRAAQQFHPFDVLRRKLPPVRAAGDVVLHAHAVHNHLHPLAVAAAHKQRGLLAGAAAAVRRSAQRAAQHIQQIHRAAALNLLAANHLHRGALRGERHAAQPPAHHDDLFHIAGPRTRRVAPGGLLRRAVGVRIGGIGGLGRRSCRVGRARKRGRPCERGEERETGERSGEKEAIAVLRRHRNLRAPPSRG